MAEETARLLLRIVTEYEAASRESLIRNVRKAMEPLGLTEHQQYHWLADLCGTKRDSSYSWFAPSRDAKIPLRVLARAAAALDISPFVFFERSGDAPDMPMRRKKLRSDCREDAVRELYRKNPEKTAAEMAAELGLARGTVQRHLKHITEAESGVDLSGETTGQSKPETPLQSLLYHHKKMEELWKQYNEIEEPK